MDLLSGQTWVRAAGLYLALATVALACWGWGRGMLHIRALHSALAPALVTPMAVTLGIGVAICALQALSIIGFLNRPAILALLVLGWVSAAVQARRHGLPRRPSRPMTSAQRIAGAALLACLLASMLAPLGPPLAWDEVAYHLPHATQWALTGRLDVSEWLRYPWFPYNYDLLYAAALVFGSDVFTHLLHALAGWLVAWLIVAWTTPHLGRTAAYLSATVWLVLVMAQFERAYVDMGVTLFVTAACIALGLWADSSRRMWLVLGGLFLGVAIGSKYQPLALLPYFALVLVWRDRRPLNWLVACLALLLPCAYWYVRNAIQTGDPVNPVGGNLFGFTNWNAADYVFQFADLRSHAGWPNVMLWPAMLLPLFVTLRRQTALRNMWILGLYMVVIWAASSRYPRYLMTAYPILAILSVAVVLHLLRICRQRWAGTPKERWFHRSLQAMMLLVGLVAIGSSARYASRIALSDSAREAVLQSRVVGYRLLQQLGDPAYTHDKIFQIGFNNALYYAPRVLWGDSFGPVRIRDFIDLPPAELHVKLRERGFTALLVDKAQYPGPTDSPAFQRHFTPVLADGNTTLYRLAP